MAALIDIYTKEELEKIVLDSHSYKEVIEKLGYTTSSGSNHQTIKSRIEKYNIDVSHFTHKESVKREGSNIFIEDSTATQQTLRRWYLKGNYTPYVCSICGQLPFWQDKPLTLILDHKNGHNKDNRFENLRWVCPNCNQQLETTGFSKTKSEELKKLKGIDIQHCCCDCGKEISKNATRCVSCASKLSGYDRRVTEHPSRDELKILIRSTPFTKIGEKFGVSDNAVKKWCITENLPSKKSEINAISDKDWELL